MIYVPPLYVDGGGDRLPVPGLHLVGLAPQLVSLHVGRDGEGEGGDGDEAEVAQDADPGVGLLLQQGAVPGPGDGGSGPASPGDTLDQGGGGLLHRDMSSILIGGL